MSKLVPSPLWCANSHRWIFCVRYTQILLEKLREINDFIDKIDNLNNLLWNHDEAGHAPLSEQISKSRGCYCCSEAGGWVLSGRVTDTASTSHNISVTSHNNIDSRRILILNRFNLSEYIIRADMSISICIKSRNILIN